MYNYIKSYVCKRYLKKSYGLVLASLGEMMMIDDVRSCSVPINPATTFQAVYNPNHPSITPRMRWISISKQIHLWGRERQLHHCWSWQSVGAWHRSLLLLHLGSWLYHPLPCWGRGLRVKLAQPKCNKSKMYYSYVKQYFLSSYIFQLIGLNLSILRQHNTVELHFI